MAVKIDTPYFDFKQLIGGVMLNCKAIMYPTRYEILLNSTTAAELTFNDDFRWMPADHTILPQEVIREIGNKIEAMYM